MNDIDRVDGLDDAGGEHTGGAAIDDGLHLRPKPPKQTTSASKLLTFCLLIKTINQTVWDSKLREKKEEMRKRVGVVLVLQGPKEQEKSEERDGKQRQELRRLGVPVDDKWNLSSATALSSSSSDDHDSEDEPTMDYVAFLGGWGMTRLSVSDEKLRRLNDVLFKKKTWKKKNPLCKSVFTIFN